MSTKIVIIGAGSGFGGRLSIDIMATEALKDATICLCDIHEGRLDKVYRYVKRTVERHNLPTKIVASTDRRALLAGADFVVTSISVGGGAYYGFPYSAEVGIPRKYGIDQSVADTTSVGAVFRFLRTGPVQQQILDDVGDLCPGALVLNHTNPMCMLSWLHLVKSNLRYVGLCHGIQWTSSELAKKVGVPVEEITYNVAGINHLAWFLEIKHKGKDLYPLIRKTLADPEKRKGEEVRYEIMKQFGYFCTESNRHDSEYMPYFRRTPELMKQFKLESRTVPDKPHEREWTKQTGLSDEEQAAAATLQRSNEYTTRIIEAVLTNVPYAFNGNVLNRGLITNLPDGCCVEAPCLVDAYGIHPCHVGDLPPQLAALNRTNVNVHELGVRAVLEQSREHAFHACAVDPVAAATLPLHTIREMFDELWKAEEDAGLLEWFNPKHKGPLPERCAE
ncbi:alpha-galactosidase [bacterium]|nr:alpha-galactosidase [bacterium]